MALVREGMAVLEQANLSLRKRKLAKIGLVKQAIRKYGFWQF
jgi:hypothetical protein